MRYDQVIYLISESAEIYNESTGNYEIERESVAIERHANISDLGTQAMNMLYGKIREGAKIFRLKGNIEAPFDYVQFGNAYYDVTLRRNINDGVILQVVKRQ